MKHEMQKIHENENFKKYRTVHIVLCIIVNLPDRQIDRQTERQTDREMTQG